jgi:hypothetical protein
MVGSTWTAPDPCRLVLPRGSDRFDRRRQPETLLHIRPLGPEKLPTLRSEARVSSCLIWSLKEWSAGTFSSGTVGGCRPPCREVTSVCSMWCAPTLPEARTDRGWPVSVRPWSWKERGAVLCRKGAWLPVGLSQEHITVSVLTYIDGPTLVATPDGGGCGRSAHCGLRPA